MKNKSYKVEAKGSWWFVILSQGSYSDYRERVFVFSGNSKEEVWEFVKVWAKEGGAPWNISGLIYGDKKFLVSDKERKPDDWEIWNTDYGAANVSIDRLHVVHVNPKELLKDN